VSAALGQQFDAAAGYEVVCIDQSASDATADALNAAGLLAHPRLRYTRTSTAGLSRARNEAVAAARSDVLAFTDDDCVPPPAWLDGLAAQLVEDPGRGVVFAALVRAVDAPEGWVPEFIPSSDGAITRSPAVVRDLGLGANFAIRRSTFDLLGGFDELLGAGSTFPASEDTDFAYRALLHGVGVGCFREPGVLHYGARAGSAASAAGIAYNRGFAAMAMKHARCGDGLMARILLREIGRWAGTGTARLARLQRPAGYRVAWTLTATAFASLRHPVDRKRRLFRTAAASRP